MLQVNFFCFHWSKTIAILKFSKNVKHISPNTVDCQLSVVEGLTFSMILNTMASGVFNVRSKVKNR